MNKEKAITLVESVIERNTKDLPMHRYAKLASILVQLKKCIDIEQIITVLLQYKDFLTRTCGIRDDTYRAILRNVRAC